VVPKTRDIEACSLQPGRPRGVARALPGVLAAVQFDDQARREARKVHHVRPERDLASEAKAVELTLTQSRPQAPFGIGGIAAQGTRYRRSHDPALARA
jgi:hypothetical protein